MSASINLMFLLSPTDTPINQLIHQLFSQQINYLVKDLVKDLPSLRAATAARMGAVTRFVALVFIYLIT